MPIGPDDDPYVAWARAAQPDAAPPPAAPPPVSGPPPGGSAGPTADPYAAWAGEPVTSPTGMPMGAGAVTSPTQVTAGQGIAPEGPITAPDEAPPTSAHTFGGLAPDDPGAPQLGQDFPHAGTADGSGTGTADRARALDAMTPEDRAAAVQSMSPDEFVTYKASRNRAAMLKQAELEHQAAAMSEARARDDLLMQRAAITKADADTRDVVARANVIANTKIDPDRFESGIRARGHFGLQVILTGLGGLVSGETGGRNLALDMFNKRVENDIAAQHADISNQWRGLEIRKGAIADEFARSGDLYKAQETYRVAAYQSAINDMQSQLQQFDPAGGTAATIRDSLDQFHAQQQATLMAFNQQQLKNHIDIAKEDREQRLASSTIAKNAAESAKLYSEASKTKADNTVLSPQQIMQQFPDYPVSAIPAGGATVGDLTKRSELHNKTLEGTGKFTSNAMQQAGTQIMGPDGNPLTRDGSPNGAPVLMADKEHAAKMNEKIAGGQDLVTSLGKVRRFLASDPSTLDRKDYAAATTDFENAKFAYAKLHDTKASSRELEAMESLFGPNFEHYSNRLKDKGVGMAHIDALVNDAQSTISNALTHEAKYTGPSVIVDTTKPEPTVATPEDRDLEAVLKPYDPAKHPKDMEHLPNAKPGGFIPGTNRDETMISKAHRTMLERWAAEAKGLDPKLAEQLQQDLGRPADDVLHQRAAAQLQATEAQRRLAISNLGIAANKANEYSVQTYARELMTNLQAESMAAVPGEPEQVR